MSSSNTQCHSGGVGLPGRANLVDSVQGFALHLALTRALDSVADCFEGRQDEPESVCSQQTEACERGYAPIDDHKTTLNHTSSFAFNLILSGVDYLKGATRATMNIGSGLRWSPLALTRSLVEASADCIWLIDPALDLETRLRRTNQMLVRACGEMLLMMPGDQEITPRFVSIDPIVRATSLEVRDAALRWAIAQGWTCANGKEITRARWIGEIPSHKELVALAPKKQEIQTIGKICTAYLAVLLIPNRY